MRSDPILEPSIGGPRNAEAHWLPPAAPRGAGLLWPSLPALPPRGPPIPGEVAARLRPFVVRQLTNTACSVAVAAAVFNAARAARGRRPLRQFEVAGLDPSGAWSAATTHDHGEGLSLAQLARCLRHTATAAEVVGLRTWSLPFARDSLRLRRRARAMLRAQQRAPGHLFVVANFMQDRFVEGGAAIGHHALSAGLSPDGRHVGIFDVDPEVPGEYLVAWSDFIAGMLPQPGRKTVRGLLAVSLGRTPACEMARLFAPRPVDSCADLPLWPLQETLAASSLT